MDVVVGQIDSFTNQTNSCTFQPCLADAGIQNRGFGPWVSADDLDHLGVVDIFDRCGTNIGRTVACWHFRLVGARLDRTAQTFDQLFQAVGSFNRCKIADDASNLFALHRCGGSGKRLAPVRFAQFTVFTDVWGVQTLTAQAIPNETCLVRNPLFVHAVVVARQNAHHFTAFGVNADVATQRVHHVDGFGFGQFPRACGESVRLGHQSANWAQVNDVALQVRIQRFVQIAGDLGIFAAAGLAHLADASNFGGETYTARAADAAGHMGFNQRTQIQIVYRALGFTEPAKIDAIGHRLILKVTFTTLVTDRTIQWVVDQQEFHHAFAGLFDHRRIGFHNRWLTFWARAQIAHLHRT